MTEGIISAIVLFLSLLAAWLKRKYAKEEERRKELEEAKEKLEQYHKTRDPSDGLDSWTGLR